MLALLVGTSHEIYITGSPQLGVKKETLSAYLNSTMLRRRKFEKINKSGTMDISHSPTHNVARRVRVMSFTLYEAGDGGYAVLARVQSL
jgi:hypothetical protein